MSIPYYSLQPGSQKNALTDDARCKYWVSAPPLSCFTGCNGAMKTATCSNNKYFELRFGRVHGYNASNCNPRYTHSSNPYSCNSCVPNVYGSKGNMGYRPNTVNVDQCYLTTYSITGPTSNIHMDEFGQSIDNSLRQRSAGSWEPPAACGYTWCGQPICGFGKCAGEEGSAPSYLRLGGSCAGLNVLLCRLNTHLYTTIEKKAARYPVCNPFYFETCDLSCGYACYTDIRPLYSMDQISPLKLSSCISNQSGYGCTSVCVEAMVFGTDDPLKSHYLGCSNCCYFTYCLLVRSQQSTIQCLSLCENIGTAWSINESTKRMHHWMSAPCGGCYCAIGSSPASRANVATAGYLLEYRIPSHDELASCAICGSSKTGVECIIALPNTIFPQCRTAYDQDRDELVCSGPRTMANMYDCIFDEGRYTILNGTTLNARTRCQGLMPYPILYDRCTSTVTTFEPFYQCCHNWNMDAQSNCNRWNCYQTNGFMALTSRNTLVHAWTCLHNLGVKEMNLDGSPITGACYTLGNIWHCGARSTAAIDFMYDKNNDSLIFSYMHGDCCCQCSNQNQITCGFTEPVVIKLPTNTCCINSVINEQAWKDRCCNCSNRCMMQDLPAGNWGTFFSGNCCSSFAMDCGYCIRTCVLPDARIFCTTPGCCGGFITACCVKQRACCYSDSCHGRGALWIDCITACQNACQHYCTGCLTSCSCNIYLNSQCNYSGRKSYAAFQQQAYQDCYSSIKYRDGLDAAGQSQYFVNPLDLKTND